MEVDLSDDVSALSMDGASAIAGMGFAKRLRKDFAKMQLGITPEADEEAEQHAEEEEELILRKTAAKVGDELIEPFPKTYEEYEKRKKEKKKKKKSHKSSRKDRHGDHHSSKKSSSGKSSRRHKEKHGEAAPVDNDVEGKRGPPPIMEISIQSTNFQQQSESSTPASPSRRQSNNQESASGIASYPSIASTADSTSNSQSRSGIIQRHHSHQTKNTNNSSTSFTGSGAMGMALKRSSALNSSFTDHKSHRSSLESIEGDDDDEESGTHMTGHSHGHSTHMTGASRASRGTRGTHGGTSIGGNTHSILSANASHVTLEDIHKLRANLTSVKREERQVLDIHTRLEKEVNAALEKAERAKLHAKRISNELELATAEREVLQSQYTQIQNENIKLKSKLRKLEEVDDDKGLDDVLDSMEAKIRELKFRSRRTREQSSQQQEKQRRRGSATG